MDSQKKNRNYDRVMSRVYNRSRSSLRSGSNVTRHDVPSSVRVGAKASVSAVSSSVFSELPTVLNEFVPDGDREKVVKRPLVRPKRTLKSLDPGKAKSPPRVSRARGLEYGRSIRARGSAPTVLSSNGEEWAESHVSQCYSSRSHTRLKELKDEIKAFHETDKMLKLRSHLYKSCGVVLDDVGRVAKDQAVQADTGPDKESTSMRRKKWLTLVDREDLLKKQDLKHSSHYVCSAHFEDSEIKIVKKLANDAVPTKLLSQELQKQVSHPNSEKKTCSRKKVIQEATTVAVETQTDFHELSKYKTKTSQTSKSQSEHTPRKRKRAHK